MYLTSSNSSTNGFSWLAPQLSSSQLPLPQLMPWIYVSSLASVAMLPLSLLPALWTYCTIWKCNLWSRMLTPHSSALELNSFSLMALQFRDVDELWSISTPPLECNLCPIHPHDSIHDFGIILACHEYCWHCDWYCHSILLWNSFPLSSSPKLFLKT